ncbi:hypothetical protein [Streptomyces colonosanans]|nr:hypothetical protein [Streptomyces colonosanans]
MADDPTSIADARQYTGVLRVIGFTKPQQISSAVLAGLGLRLAAEP